MATSMKKSALFVIVLTLALFAGVVSAYAASDEATTTVQVTFTKLPGGSKAFPAGTSRGDIVATLRAAINRPAWVGPTSFIINIGGSNYAMSRADMNPILPPAVNYDVMGDLALEATSEKDITPSECLDASYTPANRAAISNLAARLAKMYTVPGKNMSYTMLPTSQFGIAGSSVGYAVSPQGLAKAIYAGNSLWAEAGYAGPASASISKTATQAGISNSSQLGKAIKVDISERMLYLYDRGVIVAKYRVAVGMRGYSTPTGVFTIGAKRANPTWGNPGSKWARRMPRVIKPGPKNPLGLRAMNLNSGGRDTGFRIHGTSNTRSLGRAASHGCIRVANQNVVTLFSVTPAGTQVFIQP